MPEQKTKVIRRTMNKKPTAATEGVELEEAPPQEVPWAGLIVLPTRTDPNVRTLVDRIRTGKIVLRPEFQREDGCWDRVKQSRFIESLLLGIPIPPVFLCKPESGKLFVIDGLQRLSTLRDYCAGAWALSGARGGLEYLTDYRGYKFANLPEEAQDKIMEASITQLVVPGDHPYWGKRLENIVFSRINSGSPLNMAERARGEDTEGRLRRMLDEVAARIEEDMGALGRRSRAWDMAFGVALGTIAKLMSVENDLDFNGMTLKSAGATGYNKQQLRKHLMQMINAMTPEEEASFRDSILVTFAVVRECFGDYALRNVSRLYRSTQAEWSISPRCSVVASLIQAYAVNSMSWKSPDVAQRCYVNAVSDANTALGHARDLDRNVVMHLIRALWSHTAEANGVHSTNPTMITATPAESK